MEQIYECKKYPGYYVTKSGDVYSAYIRGAQGKTDINALHKLKYGKDKDGYYRVVLCTDGKKNYVKVHTLIAEQFIGEVKEPLVVNHKDGNKNNNDVSNLEIVTVKSNTMHAHAMYLCSGSTRVCVEYDGKIFNFPSMTACSRYFQELPMYYIKQLKNNIVAPSMVMFVKQYDSRISPIQCFYNGELIATYDTMQECDKAFGYARGTVSMAIKHKNSKRNIVNKFHVTFPNVSTIESVSE